MSDVAYASAKVNTLTIQLTDGKIHTIHGISHPEGLASFIRGNMPFDETGDPETLIKKLKRSETVRKNDILYVVSGVVLMFLVILAAVFMTGGREMEEFSRTDWINFSIMAVIELVTVIATFYYAAKAGKHNIPIERMQYTVRRRIIEEKALLPGNVKRVCTDDSYFGRITVFGNKDDNSGYYAVEEFDSDFNFIKIFESEKIEEIDSPDGGFDCLTDITKKYL